ncbi:hypothetical protein T439DRAFT_345565 [Meredithblackwellia eburnea MCA 4105]
MDDDQPTGQQSHKDKDSASKQSKSKEPRVGRACDACRKAKVKCLDGMPDSPCARCKSAGVPCTFEAKPTKRGPPKGYVESLERRLEAMEALLRALSATTSGNELDNLSSEMMMDDSEEGGGASGSVGPASRERSTPGSTSGASPLASLGPPKPSTNLDSVDRLAADLEELSVDKDRYVGRGSGLHLARSIRQFSQTEIPATTFGDEQDAGPSIVELLLQDDHKRNSFHFELPAQDLRDKLVDAYFTHLNSTNALLHRPSFERALKDGSLEKDTSFRSLFFMVCAVASRFVDDERLNVPYSPTDPIASKQSKGFEYFRASSGSASPALMSATLYDIQSSVLAISWLLGAATPISAWACVGFAIRRVVDVGAHRENRMRWNASPLEDQLRRRAFHALFGIDRSISAALGRPLAIHDEDCDLGDPIDISDEALDEWDRRGRGTPPPESTEPGPLAGVICMHNLQRIAGRALRLLYGMNRQSNTSQRTAEAVYELDSLLNEWLNSVPEHLKWNPTMQDPRWLAQSAALHSSYYCCQILVHRDFISPSRAQLHAFPSLAICSNAARSCSHVMDAIRERGLEQDAFWFVPLSAVTCGLILLINVFANGPTGAALTSSAMSDVKKCIAILDALAPTTFLASKCASGLSRLASMAMTPPKARDPNAPSLKRPNDFDDSASPASSSSLSNHASPNSGDVSLGDSDVQSAYKQSRKRENPHSTMAPSKTSLPLTTDDLSLLTFNGRPTFAAPGSVQWSMPGPGSGVTAPSVSTFAPQLQGDIPAFPQQSLHQQQPPPQQPSGYPAAVMPWDRGTETLPSTTVPTSVPPPGPVMPTDFLLNTFGTSAGQIPSASTAFVDPSMQFIDTSNPFASAYGMEGGPGLEWPQRWNEFDFETMLPLMTGTGVSQDRT